MGIRSTGEQGRKKDYQNNIGTDSAKGTYCTCTRLTCHCGPVTPACRQPQAAAQFGHVTWSIYSCLEQVWAFNSGLGFIRNETGMCKCSEELCSRVAFLGQSAGSSPGGPALRSPRAGGRQAPEENKAAAVSAGSRLCSQACLSEAWRPESPPGTPLPGSGLQWYSSVGLFRCLFVWFWCLSTERRRSAAGQSFRAPWG